MSRLKGVVVFLAIVLPGFAADLVKVRRSP
jgi:hypothetical protein